MKFNELKCGDMVHTFNAQTCEYSARKVNGVSVPRFDGVNREMVVDVTIDGFGTPFVCSSTAEVVTANGNLLTISPNKERVLTAIETARNGLGNILNNINTLKENYGKCEKYLLDLNPALKQQQESSEKIKALETEVANVRTDMSDLKKTLNEIKELLK